MFRKGDRVKVSDRFPATKLAIVGLTVGEAGTVRDVMRTRSGNPGIAIVDWDSGRRTNANEDDLDKDPL